MFVKRNESQVVMEYCSVVASAPCVFCYLLKLCPDVLSTQKTSLFEDTIYRVMKHYSKMKQPVPHIFVQLYSYQAERMLAAFRP